MSGNDNEASGSELGKQSQYDMPYDPTLLYPVTRSANRQEIGIDLNHLPFYGFDYWNHYEVSWLNLKGKPVVAIAEIVYDCTSPFIVESKSLKLYFNSLNNSHFESFDVVKDLIQSDLEKIIQAPATVILHTLEEAKNLNFKPFFDGDCIDDLDVECSVYTVNPSYLKIDGETVEETLYSNLLKSNCLVTTQPDWASVQISYQGPKINREGLLKYIVSMRNHNEFHEQCIERIFVDIMKYCQPTQLTVYGRYTRRGGLDINPYRSTHKVSPQNLNFRLIRQ